MTDIPMTGIAPSINADETDIQAHSFSFHASRKTFFWMLFKYAFLQLITLGIYRFWAKTHVRRYLWGSVELQGDRFEYLGTAKELFIGFLIALAVLVPLGIISLFAQFILSAGSIGFVIYYGAYFVAILFLINFAVFRLWRYRLTRSSWRGMRFNMEQGALKYAGIAMLWAVASIITLGIVYPWMQAYLTRYKINKVRFGGGVFACDIKGSQLFVYYLAFFGGLIAIYGLLALGGFALTILAQLGSEGGESFMASATQIIALVTYGASFILVPIAFGWLQVEILNKIIGQVSLDGCYFSSHLQFRKVMPAIFTFAIMFVMLYLLIGLPLVGFGAAIDDFGAVSSVLVFLSMLLLIAIVLIMSILYNVIVGFASMREFFQNMQITNPHELDKIVSDGKNIPAHGEGFADAFDVGAF